MSESTDLGAACRLPDGVLVQRIVAGESDLFEALLRRYNQRLFRIVRAVVGSDPMAEDALQDAYLNAFAKLSSFRGCSSFATWISRIALRTASARRKRERRADELRTRRLALFMPSAKSASPPDACASGRELRGILEGAIDALPRAWREVVVLRLVEEQTTEETAAQLEVSEEVVRVRLFRARTKLSEVLSAQHAEALPTAFAFAGARCERIVQAVLLRLESLTAKNQLGCNARTPRTSNGPQTHESNPSLGVQHAPLEDPIPFHGRRHHSEPSADELRRPLGTDERGPAQSDS